jgi:hypothetical protein
MIWWDFSACSLRVARLIDSTGVVLGTGRAATNKHTQVSQRQSAMCCQCVLSYFQVIKWSSTCIRVSLTSRSLNLARAKDPTTRPGADDFLPLFIYTGKQYLLATDFPTLHGVLQC